MQALSPHRKSYPLRTQMRRRTDIVLLVLLAFAILALTGLVLTIGPNLWVLLNALMQHEAG